MAKDPTVLSYHNSCLSRSDVDLLSGPNWLNDEVIGFVFEYYEYDQFKSQSDQVAFVSPSVTQFLKFVSQDEMAIHLGPLNLDKKKYIFLAVNDMETCEAAGGTHWSLLLFDRPNNTFHHYDSFSGSNSGVARDLARSIEPSLKVAEKTKFNDASAPQQTNGCDCGVYVVFLTEELSKHFLCNTASHSESKNPLVDRITPEAVKAKRSQLLELIHKLAQEGYVP